MATLYDLVSLCTESEECYIQEILADNIDLKNFDEEKAEKDLLDYSFGAFESTITEEQAKTAVQCIKSYLAPEQQRWDRDIKEPLEDIDIGDWLKC
jgi:hypothetical protein